jgi:hypothetical protein
MNPVLFDVTGQEKYYVNLCLVRQIKVEKNGEGADVTFTYTNGAEGIFKVPSGRLVVLLGQIGEWAVRRDHDCLNRELAQLTVPIIRRSPLIPSRRRRSSGLVPSSKRTKKGDLAPVTK